MKLHQELRRLLKQYAAIEGTDFTVAIRDALTELMHACEKEGTDFEDRLASAREVCAEEEEQGQCQASPPDAQQVYVDDQGNRGRVVYTAATPQQAAEVMQSLNDAPHYLTVWSEGCHVILEESEWRDRTPEQVAAIVGRIKAPQSGDASP